MDDETELLPLRQDAEPGRPRFDVVRRNGYDRDQVDQEITWLEQRAEDAERQRTDAETAAARAVADAQQAREELTAGRPSWQNLGGRVTQILTLAEEEAASIRAKAKAEVETSVRQAQQTTAEAARLHEQRLVQAAQESDQVLRKAHGEADRVVREAQQVALTEERASQRRLGELERQREQVHRQLTRVRDGLAAAVGTIATPTEDDPEDDPEAGAPQPTAGRPDDVRLRPREPREVRLDEAPAAPPPSGPPTAPRPDVTTTGPLRRV